jgi:hypothetical protein
LTVLRCCPVSTLQSFHGQSHLSVERYLPTSYNYDSGLSSLLKKRSLESSEVHFFGASLSSFKKQIHGVLVK